MRDLGRTGDDVHDAHEADKWLGSRHVVQVRPHVWRWVAPRVGGGPVLEIGPGLRPTAPAATSTFVDASGHALEQLAARGARTATAGAALPFEDGAFEAVLAFEVLEHVDDDEGLLREIARVSRPASLLLLSTPVHAARWSPLDDACGHVRRDEPDVCFAKVREAGFAIGGYAWSPAALRPLTRARAAMLTSNRQLSTAFVQRWVFPLHAAYQRRFERLRWIAPDVPVSAEADDLMLWARRRDAGDG
ncbi:MAG TPA: methyltransferase domain-containing protein [Actinomycetota bacterium]|nr:methyltransferase domain-containing protein [Actinomycetota bacterium]